MDAVVPSNGIDLEFSLCDVSACRLQLYLDSRTVIFRYVRIRECVFSQYSPINSLTHSVFRSELVRKRVVCVCCDPTQEGNRASALSSHPLA